MFGSAILEAAIGMLLVYLLLSLISSALQETIEGFLKMRAAGLERGLREMLQDRGGTGLSQHVYEHPLISSLFIGDYEPVSALRRKLPTYIPAASFAKALMDIIVRGPVNATVSASEAATSSEVVITLQSFRTAVVDSNLLTESIRRALLTAIDSAEGDLGRAQANLEAWFNTTMDRVSGRYKRYTHWVLLTIGLLLSVTLNIDSLRITERLYNNDALRAAVVAQAAEFTKENPTIPKGSLDNTSTVLKNLNLPVGWANEGMEKDPWYLKIGDALGSHLIGWLITAFAVSFGAPFWFDVLNKMMVIRSTVKPHEKSPEEASEDRQIQVK